MTEKAVETMLEKASELPEYSETTRPAIYFKSGFRLGYHQAEKDLELTWEDIRNIYDLAYNLRFPHTKQKEFFEEVLKHFKEKR